MPSPALLDFAALTAPIPGDKPAGQKVPQDVRDRLDEARKEVNPEDIDPNDPYRLQPKKADWPAIVKEGKEILTGRSKDLQTIFRLAEALTKINGFAGVRDSLRLAREIVEKCWDRMHPEMEPGDAEAIQDRAQPFDSFDATYADLVRAIPIAKPKGIVLSRHNWDLSKKTPPKFSPADIDTAVNEAGLPECELALDDLTQAQTEFGLLLAELTKRMAAEGPGLSKLRQTLTDCHWLAKFLVDKKKPVAQAAATEGNGAPQAGAAPAARAPVTREDIYKQLEILADSLQKLEPHNPVPYLVRRAVELGKQTLPELLKDLVRKDDIVKEMFRELGIKSK